MASIQQDRPLALTTPLGEDALLIRQFRGTERLGRLFEYQLDLVGTDESLDFAGLLGKSVTIRLKLEDGERHFNGIVTRLTQAGRLGGYARFHAIVRPTVWLFTRKSNCRIFQSMTTPDIVKKVLQDDGFTDLEARLSGSYPTLEYCVQYRESDFDFCSRLLEHEGIYFFFEHAEDKHVLVLADEASSHQPIASPAEIPFRAPDSNVARTADHIFGWTLEQEIQSGRCSVTDYCFETPNVALFADASVSSVSAASKLEVYDYPGTHQVTDVGRHYATARIQELHAEFETVRGTGTVRAMASGSTFKLVENPRDDQNREYLCVSVQHMIDNPEYDSSGGAQPVYTCELGAIDIGRPFRPARTTDKPMIRGPQTAVVTGPSGEEIWTDKYGRVKVQFHWDREGKKDENTSCWIRVAHLWAGKNWGGVHIPRIGQEVIVEFLEGDPDRPIITGSVYNADQMPPYALPANQTQSGLKSRSSKGGGTEDFNELRFEDKKGEEQVFLHAQKNQDIEVENDETHWVGHDRTKTIDNDETTHVKHDRTETVGNNETITIGANRTENVEKNETITIGENRTETVGKNESISIGENRTEAVGKDESITIGQNRTETVGKDESISIGGAQTTSIAKSRTMEIGESLTVTIGDSHTENVEKNYMLTAKKVQIRADDEVTIVTGDASISMKKNGAITIKGKDVTVEGSGKINVKASSDLVLKGSKIAGN